MRTKPAENTDPAASSPTSTHRPVRLGVSLALAAATVVALTGCAEAIRNAEHGGSSSSAPEQTAGTEAPGVQIFEDFACPHCAAFHEQNGGLIHGLVSGGKLEADYRIVDFLGQGDPESWSTRAANAYYCLEDSLGSGPGHDEAAANKLHAFQSWLFEQATTQPDDATLVAQADEIGGRAASVEQCVTEDGGAPQITAAMSDFSDLGLRGVPSVYSTADSTPYNPEQHGDLKTWLTDRPGQ
ncbi:DsbA family protein [Citricoccus alkalitolerans]|uniref:DsbA family protein n=1 Tax=Citricoccus alkalitolerans TaxID=246603 RepID=A0ABV8Y205_9MICC